MVDSRKDELYVSPNASGLPFIGPILSALGFNGAVSPAAPETWGDPGTLLPVQRSQVTGAAKPAVPQAVGDIISALSLPGDVAASGAAGNVYQYPDGTISPLAPEHIERAAGFPAEVSMPGLAAGAAKAAASGLDPNTLSIFAGPSSQTADLQMLKAALAGEARGVPKADIYDSTGWYKGRDGKWKYEIDDSELTTAVAPRNYGAMHGPAKELIYHPKLFEAYPDLEKVLTTLRLYPSAQKEGYYQPAGGMDPPEIMAMGENPKDITGTVAHELQHAVQNIERFAGGGSPDEAGEVIRALAPNAALQLKLPAPIDLYRALMGEVEARAVEDRWQVPSQKKYNRPWESEDLPAHAQFRPSELIKAANAGVVSEEADAMTQRLMAYKEWLDLQRDRKAADTTYVIEGWPGEEDLIDALTTLMAKP